MKFYGRILLSTCSLWNAMRFTSKDAHTPTRFLEIEMLYAEFYLRRARTREMNIIYRHYATTMMKKKGFEVKNDFESERKRSYGLFRIFDINFSMQVCTAYYIVASNSEYLMRLRNVWPERELYYLISRDSSLFSSPRAQQHCFAFITIFRIPYDNSWSFIYFH